MQNFVAMHILITSHTAQVPKTTEVNISVAFDTNQVSLTVSDAHNASVTTGHTF